MRREVNERTANVETVETHSFQYVVGLPASQRLKVRGLHHYIGALSRLLSVPAFSADFKMSGSTREMGKAPNHLSQYLFTSQARFKGESSKNASVASLRGPSSLHIRRATSSPHCQQGSQSLLCTHRHALYVPSSRANGLLSARQCTLGPTWLYPSASRFQ